MATKLRQYLPTGRVAHLQIAGVPERHEPDVGELDYSYLLNLIDKLLYKDWVGCECRTQRGAIANGTSDELSFLCEFITSDEFLSRSRLQ